MNLLLEPLKRNCASPMSLLCNSLQSPQADLTVLNLPLTSLFVYHLDIVMKPLPEQLRSDLSVPVGEVKMLLLRR